MKLSLFSDLHFEFHADKGESFIDSMDLSKTDILILAGDITTHDNIFDTLKLFSTKNIPVLYILGNHEFYNSSFEKVYKTIKSIKLPNIHILNNDIIEINGTRFLGTTMWFRDDAYNSLYKKGMNDFHIINNFERNVYVENNKALEFLYNNVKEGDVVITHHLPSEKCIHPLFKKSSLNNFFVCDVEGLIIGREPKLWCFGHTHYSFDMNIGATRVISNPFGYVGHELNSSFNDELVIEI